MINKVDKNANRIKRHVKIRHDLAGTTKRPRLCVYRSLNHIYAQIVDDSKGVTLVACNTTQKEVAAKVKDMTNKEQARYVGEQIAKLAKKKKITEITTIDNGNEYMVSDYFKEYGYGISAAHSDTFERIAVVDNAKAVNIMPKLGFVKYYSVVPNKSGTENLILIKKYSNH